MSKFLIDVMVCDDSGQNCQGPVTMASTEIPVADGWFGLEPGTPQYWEIVSLFTAAMGLVWMFRFIVRFVSGRR